MMSPNDFELLRHYLEGGSEDAFATLVHRHLDLVYSAALRLVRCPQMAQEVAQCVFADLSKCAAHLTDWKSGTLAGWLYQVTRRTAVDALRRQSRRESRERLAFELSAMNENPSFWSQIEPLLDEAMEQLEPSERNAVLLRFFENKTLREVGQTLGTSEEAAQKRVSRAIERLRGLLSKRGVAVGAGGLVAVLSANAVQSAPLGLATTICTAASGAAVPTLSLAGTTKLIAMTTMQKILITASVAAALGAGLYEAHQAADWREHAQALQRQQEPLSERIHQLQRERDEATARLGATRQERELSQQDTAELLRLRGEVARLREDSRELAQLKADKPGVDTDPQLESAFKTWALRASRLRQRLNQTPGQQIPELQLLTEKGWFDAVKGMNQLETDEDFNKASSNARNIAKNEFGRLLQKALRAYTDANGGVLPQDLAQLKPFFDQPVDDSILQRYKLLQTGRLSDLPGQSYLVAENAPLVDENNDATYQFSLNGTNSHSGDQAEEAIKNSVIQYAKAHDDLLPTDPDQLTPYLKQTIDPQKIRSLMAKVPPGVTTLRQLNAVLY